jgi:Tfp pilus assembly protein PilV
MSITARLRDDDGFGLTEIVVSMFMLALIAVAFLPLLINGLKTSSATATLATATQFLNTQMQKASAVNTCSAATSLGGVQSLTDPRGVVIQLTTTVGSCPTGPGTIAVSATAIRNDTGATLATGSTLVFLP